MPRVKVFLFAAAKPEKGGNMIDLGWLGQITFA
jgi:hypothetical protein